MLSNVLFSPHFLCSGEYKGSSILPQRTKGRIYSSLFHDMLTYDDAWMVWFHSEDMPEELVAEALEVLNSIED